MREFNEISALWRAPTLSRAFYQDVALRWKGIGLRYLFLILLLTWGVVFARGTYSMTHFINTEAAADLKDFPPITIKAGHASSPVPQPYTYRDSAGRPIFGIDTTGASKVPADLGVKMLLTETNLLQEEATGSVKTTPLAGVPDMVVDSDHIIGWMSTFRSCLLPVGLPLATTFFVIYRLIVALIFAAIGLGFASMFGVKLPYSALLRLAIVAMTLDVLISCIFWTIPVPDGCSGWLIGHAVSLGYLAYGIKVTATFLRPGASGFEVQPAQPTSAPTYQSPGPSAPAAEENDLRFP